MADGSPPVGPDRPDRPDQALRELAAISDLCAALHESLAWCPMEPKRRERRQLGYQLARVAGNARAAARAGCRRLPMRAAGRRPGGRPRGRRPRSTRAGPSSSSDGEPHRSKAAR